MINTIEFINNLRKLDINLFMEGERLRCNAPEGTLTPALKSEINGRKAEIISFLHQANNQKNASALAPISRTENNTFPLSFAQQRLWFLNQLQPNSAFYNIPLGLHFSGQLNIAALESSLQLLINRHEILRTNFIAVDGEPVQAIAVTRDFTLPVVDFRPLPASERELEYDKLASQSVMYVFNLAQEPLLRAQLVQLTPTENVLLLIVHHIIFDGWSVNIFVQELTTIYSALVEHHTPTLPEINLQYVDFAVWQQQWLQGEVLQSQLAYWQQKLAGMPALLELPTDRPRPAVQSFRGKTQVFTLEQDISEALVSLSQQQGVTLFMLLLTAFKILLYRYTNQLDIVVGSSVANRQYPQIQGMIGFFVNNLVLRTDLSENPTFLQLLQQVKQVVLEAYDRQDLPFDKLVEALQPERHLSYSPLFQISFDMEHESTSDITLQDLKLNISEPGSNDTAKFDLSLSLQKTKQGLTGAFEYSTDLFDTATIARMIEHWQTLLAGILANPEQRLSDLPILTAIEQSKLLVEWNQTQQDYPQNLCIHQLFEVQVEQTPDAVAVIFKEEHLTYRELNAKANQLAHHLQALGVKPETLVGICVERSLEMIVGLLGILKAGGAYVPIDPAYPSERITFMLKGSSVPVLLTQFRFVESLPEYQARVVCLDFDWEEISRSSEKNPTSNVTPHNLAYAIYTSGSTGQPKGVLISHQALVNHSVSIAKHYDLQATDRVLQFTSISFDVAAEEVFPTWIGGGTVVLRLGSISPTIAEFQELINREKLTVLNLPASYWHEWVFVLDSSEIQLPSSLRLVVVGNEKVLPDKLIDWQKIVGNHIRWLNAYGLTETTITSTIYEPDIWKEKNLADVKAVPIGRPIANTQVYVLDTHLQPVPIGVPGELYTGGDGLARGYLNRPDLTQQRFIRNPFNNQPGSYLYKTGDVVRYLPDGNLELVGRTDNQVKIRGFRIELGEIESVLNQHLNVREAVVIDREDVPTNKNLVAYIVSNLFPERVPYQIECLVELSNGTQLLLQTRDISFGGVGLIGKLDATPGQEIHLQLQLPSNLLQSPLKGRIAWHQEQQTGVQLILTPETQSLWHQNYQDLLESSGMVKSLQRILAGNLRDFIKQKLPSYMVPSSFVLLEAMPLTPNGKVDRRQLPVPTGNTSEMIESKNIPCTSTEILVSHIWAGLLGLKQVGVNDNFFELGGNSLLVIRLLSKLHEVCGVDIPIHRLFEFPTVAGIAQLIDKIRQVGTIDNLTDNILDLSAEVFLDKEIQPHSLAFNQIGEPKCIFLTDATGFCGSYLLYELLLQTTADIYCLVNASNSDEGKNRLRTQLEFYTLWQPTFSSRIIPVIGDLSQSRLGISAAEFQNLANRIDVIYHNGESNNIIYPYSALKAVNVTATQDVLRLASQIKIKPVHFISTLGVFYSPHYFQRQLIAESDPLDSSQGLTSGYGQSKWVAEKLMNIARERGLPVCIYRLGRFAGHSQTGAVATDDWLFRTIKGCIQLGMFPELEMMVEMIPVDYVSKAIVGISQAKSSLGQAFHITNHHQISWEYLINWIQSFGYPVKQVSTKKWRQELIHHLNYFPENALHSLLPMFSEEAESQKIEFKFDNQNTREALSGTEICCPPLNAELLNIYFSYFLNIGFLSAPEPTTIV
ncbi:amino acid adenylation domain-containing protein [Microcoleus sp. w2-18bC1]|uniref:amino acid adenylation domain-containing protein n=1 Tax=unclassified Microcoleus TaxID=2642155 RepID=UPI002FD00297